MAKSIKTYRFVIVLSRRLVIRVSQLAALLTAKIATRSWGLAALLVACSLQLAAQSSVQLAARSSQLEAQHTLLEARSSQLAANSYWQQQVDYTIDVTLNTDDHTLDGFLKLRYYNNSPDTLRFIWFHVWPNAYKNDRTAFSEQLLQNGRTDFYFSDRPARGYINRLDFRADGIVCRVEDHPQYIDIIKVILPAPLAPGAQLNLTTPFHEQLPFNFSRGGHVGHSYQVTQWYPKPAVYDRTGWHPIPYLDQGEFFSEFGSFDVRITVPGDYIVAATGELQEGPGLQESPHRQESRQEPAAAPKTLRYRQDRIHDFAWFADRQFQVDHDTLQLPSGRTIDLYAYYTPTADPAWKNSIQYMKDAVRFRSALIGEYPFQVVTAVEAKMGTAGGMEYPTITSINFHGSAGEFDEILEHEIGHNWFYAILGTNERRFPWMDEGINTYYDNRYMARKARAAALANLPKPPASNNWFRLKVTPEMDQLFINTLARENRDQPISTSSEMFTATNYDLIAYSKTGLWMKELEDSLGKPLFDSCMRTYFRTWQFKHPYPEDFRTVVEQTSHRDLQTLFARLDTKGTIPPFPPHRILRPTFLFSTHETSRYDYINILPAIGKNFYDGFMVGLLVHNYNLPPDRLQFLAAPLYATASHSLEGLGRISYTWYPDGHFRKVELGLAASRFATLSALDSNGKKIFGGFYKVAPYLRLYFPKPDPRSTRTGWVEWKTYFIGEKDLDDYVPRTSDSTLFPTEGKYEFRYLNQLSLQLGDQRVLYPYNALLQFQQAADFYRVNFTGNYFFNYQAGGGMNVRLFAAKFGYLGNPPAGTDLQRFMPKLTALRGNEDYTYSNYFIGRNEFDEFASQQILRRDGDLKLRTDLFQVPGIQGRSDDWVASMNFTSTLPPAIVPKWFPVRLFLDIGTYSDAWKQNPPTSRFLYVAGFQISLLHDVFNVYIPVVYSSEFGDLLKTVPDENTFWKKISFSIDIQNFNLKKIFSIPL
jgi:hypothetical protein